VNQLEKMGGFSSSLGMDVMLNFAISADGKIGTKVGGASKFTSQEDLERLWKIRKKADAIMVGRKTLEADHMTMTIPEAAKPIKQPLRMIVSRAGRFNFQHPIFQKDGGPIYLLSTEREVNHPNSQVNYHHSSLPSFLNYCDKELGVKDLLCEGGGELVDSLARLNVITEINLTIAGHTLIGGKEAPTILGKLSEHLPQSVEFRLSHFEPLENGECFLTYIRKS